MYAKTQLPAPAKSVNTFPTNCCSFSLSIVVAVDVDVEADEDDDELICWGLCNHSQIYKQYSLKRNDYL
jgi:hypothetical protein